MMELRETTKVSFDGYFMLEVKWKGGFTHKVPCRGYNLGSQIRFTESLFWVESYDYIKCTKEEYESNYRFIFLHYDTDYYISNDQPGILLRNLQRILNDLGIPNYFCLILTEQDIQPELNRLCIEETRDTTPIACIQHSCQDLLYSQPVVGVSLNVDAISHKFMSLNKVRRFHSRIK